MNALGALLLFLGAAIAVFGVSTMTEAPEIVGGDAYNFIIGAVRGVGWVAAGGVASPAGIGFLILGRNLRDQRASLPERVPEEPTTPKLSPFAIAEDFPK
jgi:hypothetical protein